LWWYVIDRPLITEAIHVTAVPDFSAGGYRYEDLKRERIVSSRSDLHNKQKRYGFPRPIKLGLSTAWYPKSEVHAWLAQRAALRDRPDTS
jgi:predicted DNA-binding transcriptional regulator AlpA